MGSLNARHSQTDVVIDEPQNKQDIYPVQPAIDVPRSSIMLLLAGREEDMLQIGKDASSGERLRPAGPTPLWKARSDDED